MNSINNHARRNLYIPFCDDGEDMTTIPETVVCDRCGLQADMAECGVRPCADPLKYSEHRLRIVYQCCNPDCDHSTIYRVMWRDVTRGKYIDEESKDVR
jgi:hypothetical protein